MKWPFLLMFGSYTVLSAIYGNTELVNMGFATIKSSTIINYAPLVAFFVPLVPYAVSFLPRNPIFRSKDDSLDLISQLELKYYEDKSCRDACRTLREAALERLHSS